MEQICYQCHISRPIEQYYKDCTRPKGHRSICKTCCSQNQAAARQANHAYVLARDAKFRLKYAAKRPAILKSWRLRNPTRYVDYVAKRRALKKGSMVYEEVAVLVLYARDQAICSLCGKHVKRKDASIDHIIPLTKGGEHSYRNTALAHLLCNNKKRNGIRTQQMRLF